MLFRVRQGPTDPSPRPNPEEIIEGRFFSRAEIERGIANEPETFAPSFRLLLRRYTEEIDLT